MHYKIELSELLFSPAGLMTIKDVCGNVCTL